ncbi:hypothetical protein L1077_20270 [Pseudoalteromonas luteoviolacea]|uniref:hypothetical protein n=1 Tax=Pseudoalteromonas luteoviolacea TaxID=43657 RepID=UPI001F2596FF|nr:hypothetical protein [Pseudoalteromonas luteoviolacea]MCF6441776.1 hypothetical protein [Pseudoalteromonas luteoviolacea]
MKKQLAMGLLFTLGSINAFAQECKTEVETSKVSYYQGFANCSTFVNGSLQNISKFINLTTNSTVFIGDWVYNPATKNQVYATCFANVPFAYSETKTTNVRYCKNKVLIEARGGSPEHAMSILRQRGATEVGGCRPDFTDQPVHFVCAGYILDWVKQ